MSESTTSKTFHNYFTRSKANSASNEKNKNFLDWTTDYSPFKFTSFSESIPTNLKQSAKDTTLPPTPKSRISASFGQPILIQNKPKKSDNKKHISFQPTTTGNITSTPKTVFQPSAPKTIDYSFNSKTPSAPIEFSDSPFQQKDKDTDKEETVTDQKDNKSVSDDSFLYNSDTNIDNSINTKNQ